MHCVIARVDAGLWSHHFAAESIRVATFQSRRRAEGIVSRLRQVAEKEGNGCEYRIIPIMRIEQQF